MPCRRFADSRITKALSERGPHETSSIPLIPFAQWNTFQINLSSQKIEVHGFLDFARELCEQLGIPAGQIAFEITEGEAIEDIAGMRTFLRELRKKGFSFALDDFGSGYNSFHYLRELYFDYVKIDGAFIQNLSHSRTDRALVRNLTRLCKELGMKTIAEYVENQKTLGILQETEVDFVQGYYFSLPTAGF